MQRVKNPLREMPKDIFHAARRYHFFQEITAPLNDGVTVVPIKLPPEVREYLETIARWEHNAHWEHRHTLLLERYPAMMYLEQPIGG